MKNEEKLILSKINKNTILPEKLIKNKSNTFKINEEKKSVKLDYNLETMIDIEIELKKEGYKLYKDIVYFKTSLDKEDIVDILNKYTIVSQCPHGKKAYECEECNPNRKKGMGLPFKG